MARGGGTATGGHLLTRRLGFIRGEAKAHSPLIMTLVVSVSLGLLAALAYLTTFRLVGTWIYLAIAVPQGWG